MVMNIFLGDCLWLLNIETRSFFFKSLLLGSMCSSTLIAKHKDTRFNIVMKISILTHKNNDHMSAKSSASAFMTHT